MMTFWGRRAVHADVWEEAGHHVAGDWQEILVGLQMPTSRGGGGRRRIIPEARVDVVHMWSLVHGWRRTRRCIHRGYCRANVEYVRRAQ